MDLSVTDIYIIAMIYIVQYGGYVTAFLALIIAALGWRQRKSRLFNLGFYGFFVGAFLLAAYTLLTGVAEGESGLLYYLAPLLGAIPLLYLRATFAARINLNTQPATVEGDKSQSLQQLIKAENDPWKKVIVIGALGILAAGTVFTIGKSAVVTFDCVWNNYGEGGLVDCWQQYDDRHFGKTAQQDRAEKASDEEERGAYEKYIVAIDKRIQEELRAIHQEEGAYPVIARFRTQGDRKGYEKLFQICINSLSLTNKIDNSYKLGDPCPEWWSVSLTPPRRFNIANWSMYAYSSKSGQYSTDAVGTGLWKYDSTKLVGEIYQPVVMPFLNQLPVGTYRTQEKRCTQDLVINEASVEVVLKDINTAQYLIRAFPNGTCSTAETTSIPITLPNVEMMVEERGGNWSIAQWAPID